MKRSTPKKPRKNVEALAKALMEPVSKATASTSAELPTLLSCTECFQLTGLSPWSWRQWCYTGRISSVKLGRRLLVPASEVARLISEGTRPRRVA